MKKLLAIPFASVILIFVLTACGTALQPANLDHVTAVAFNNLAYQASQFQLSTLQEPVEFNVATTSDGTTVPKPLTELLVTAGVVPQAECVVATGTTTDADFDTIPVHAYYDYNCTETVSDVTTDISGRVEVSDKDDGDKFAGYTLDMSDLTYSITSGGNTSNFTFNLGLDITVEGTRYDAVFDLEFALDGPGGSAGFSYDVDQTYIANSEIDPFSSGTLDFTGNLTLRTSEHIYSLDVDGPNHVIDTAGCHTDIRSGTTVYSDNAGNSLTIDFACDRAFAEFNGTELAEY